MEDMHNHTDASTQFFCCFLSFQRLLVFSEVATHLCSGSLLVISEDVICR
eukprot:m.190767 g.190767  ORF g.190767 m.190767 type:complete len:50 (-) comp18571_c0_seq3:630-779(-)